ncbi:GNAT family N-acetyltransferase [Marinomonas mediterranea]|uniref:GCN5-related N-acetyltransferase n=1 Tax=Marinomonas mediterranea (strain ATCC 700492 / JCM 21426 / NBRC 103028 / MMB-1) TaxID=717774 RepID=F2JZW4_MARM1|nr:GNAT family N-acetyltransferase [Marinomonas mediterranea]ADZ92076.1 GCN5-related N-acetyltransferase [Marinomonas mediterranea MMB-1]WCN10038.1 GNAT family N-acetyltransferase [Marinomonas mediterranea]WCN14088.1 GNAT family N-acetyltransferase [Marinomonas mediterranea]WCN18144.1 GNAT family N-acetyltransferase [Marinomonas mediterranea MMB-1]
MGYVIRAALESDAQGINEVSQYLGYSALSLSESLLKLQALLNSSNDWVYVAQLNDHVVGWLHLFYAHRLASESFYEIGGLVVSEDVRGQGIGRALVQYALDAHKGKFRVRCNELRTDSHQFYEAIGFSSSKSQRVFQIRL